MQKVKKAISLLMMLSLLLLAIPSRALATEGDSEKSASVKTEGVITFESTSETTVETTSTSELPITNSPGGKLPDTGETVNQGVTLGGISLLILASLLFFFKGKKNEEESHQDQGGMSK